MKTIALASLIVAFASVVLSSLLTLEIDNIVHGTLYSYGLQFSHAWADPYWNMLHFLFVCNVAGLVTAAFAFCLQLLSEPKLSKKQVFVLEMTALIVVVTVYFVSMSL